MKPYYLISDDKTFAFSAENPTGTRGGGSRGGDCTKLRPTVTINPGETVTLVDIRYVSSQLLGEYLSFENQDILFAYSTLILNNSSTLK